MTDNVTKEKRSYIMSRIRGSNTLPERKLKKLLKSLNFKYQPKGIYGRPDFANRDENIAVFIDGCFWHGCDKHFKMPKSNTAFWRAKVRRNRKNDKAITLALKEQGWRVIRVWEHDIKNV